MSISTRDWRDLLSGVLGLALVLGSAANAFAASHYCIGSYVTPGAGLACHPVACPQGCASPPGQGTGTVTFNWNPPSQINVVYEFCVCNGLAEQECCHIVSFDGGTGFGTRGVCNETECWGGINCIAVNNGSGGDQNWGVWCDGIN